MAYDIGLNIVKQKDRFIGQENGPKSADDVDHIVDLVRSIDHEKLIVRETILQGARAAGSDTGIMFLNDN